MENAKVHILFSNKMFLALSIILVKETNELLKMLTHFFGIQLLRNIFDLSPSIKRGVSVASKTSR